MGRAWLGQPLQARIRVRDVPRETRTSPDRDAHASSARSNHLIVVPPLPVVLTDEEAESSDPRRRLVDAGAGSTSPTTSSCRARPLEPRAVPMATADPNANASPSKRFAVGGLPLAQMIHGPSSRSTAGRNATRGLPQKRSSAHLQARAWAVATEGDEVLA